MNLKNQPPIFVPEAHWAEIEKLSKAALMDMVWHMASQLAPGNDDVIMAQIRKTAERVTNFRKQAA